MSDQVQEKLKWLQLELERARRAMRKALRALEEMPKGGEYNVKAGKARAILTTALERPYSIHHHKARLAGIKDDKPP